MAVSKLSKQTVVPAVNFSKTLDWFIGAGVDAATLTAMKEEDEIQKALMAKEISEDSKV